ncbi:protein FAR1-RELATED SEQUENCE 5-like [Salvia hispanica]|uniref:protein FAR1-RELATED SEQUENCE 5-like n=1 Tax=Salvia hispanica TaxID=49212 RepID=UPI002009C666|nr:protein FAR1-RELATED SEQUENCE 5-like [Salvia hispanica]
MSPTNTFFTCETKSDPHLESSGKIFFSTMEEGGSSTMDEAYASTMEEVVVVPDCSKDLKPVVGQKFKSLDFGFAFYDVYARAVGFDTQKSQMRKTDGVITWYNVEILGGFQLVGCNVGDIRNASRDIKAYAHGIDIQMVFDDMARKKEMSETFTYEYEVKASNQLVALFWCDGLMNRNYHMFDDIVAFDTTYNTNRYCMIFAPFTEKDNHGQPVTFAAGLTFFPMYGGCSKDDCYRSRSAIEEILIGTRHRWCMWHIMHKLANKVPGRLLRDEDFKKEFNACVWSDLLEPDEFEEEWNGVVERYGLKEHSWFKTLYEYRQLWIPAYFRDFPMGWMIRTTSISESENSFYKNFLKPCNNIAEFYLNFNQVVDFQRNSRTKLDYQDATALPILATTLPFEKHASTLYTDSMFKKIQEEIVEENDRCRVLGRQGYLCCHVFFLFRNNEVKKIPDNYCASRWMKTPLAKAIHGHLDETLLIQSVVGERKNISKQEISLFYGFLCRFETDIDVLRAFVGGLEELGNSLQAGTPLTSASEKRRMIEQFYGMERPEFIEVHPPDVVKMKGHTSRSASRLISKREKAIKDATRPLRRCKACDELYHHDFRNCPILKKLEAENELHKGKRKC